MEIDRVKKGMPVIVEDKFELYAGTVVESSPETGEFGVRRESSGEARLIPSARLHLSFRKGGGTRPALPLSNNGKMADLEAYVVALSKGQISRQGLNEIAALIEKKGSVREIRSQELVKYY